MWAYQSIATETLYMKVVFNITKRQNHGKLVIKCVQHRTQHFRMKLFTNFTANSNDYFINKIHAH